ncbi:hypothetical protein M408DRAFT_11555 [Serendipita vermifera MAFF 305830]|uniref:Ferric reductase NAD binding domain-containing protein n=1 Tax=Serendipita vermifera MAFF 305830 TaxID=933852 RepID=A0A0C3AVP1_SERVB|nr:hypothetical protein M408DRAFT_11555 [Serendipita vermifera MAFF 305830]
MFESEFLDMKQVAAIAGGAVTLRVNVTGHAGDEEQSARVAEDGDSSSHAITMATGRPDIHSLISEMGSRCAGHVGVAVCGPLSLMTDASNAVSNVQLDILRGRASCTEIYERQVMVSQRSWQAQIALGLWPYLAAGGFSWKSELSYPRPRRIAFVGLSMDRSHVAVQTSHQTAERRLKRNLLPRLVDVRFS